MRSIDPNAMEPLYKQLKQVLVDAIDRKEIAAGQQIPSESSLAQKYAISRITVRNAIRELVDEGILVRRQGKGTYVSGAMLERNFEEIDGYSQSMMRQGYKPGRIIIRKEQIFDNLNNIKELLGIDYDRPVIHIRRLLLANDEPMLVEDAYYSEKFKFLLTEDLANVSTYVLFRKLLNIVPSKAIRTISLGLADQEIADYMKIKKNEPLLSVHELVYDQHGNPVHFSNSLAISQKTKIQITAYATSSSEDYKMIPPS